MALDSLFSPRKEEETQNSFLLRCTQHAHTSLEWCVYALGGDRSTSSKRTARYCAGRVLLILKMQWHHWQHELIGSTSISILDLLFIVWVHLEFVRDVTISYRSVHYLTGSLEKVKQDWHRKDDTRTIECMEDLTRNRSDIFASICTQLSTFDAHALLHEKKKARSLIFGVDVHAEFDNRVKDVEENKGSASSLVVSTTAKSNSAPIDFVQLSSRVIMTVSLEVDLLLTYPNHHKWVKGYMQTHKAYQRMCTYLVTPETENLLRDLHVIRNLPMGAICHALKTNLGRREQISLETLAHDELGGDSTRIITERAVQPCSQIADEFFSAENQNAWSKLHDDWLLVLFDREVRTHAHLSPLVHYIIIQQDLAIKQERWREKVIHDSPRLPLMIEAWGQWCVCYGNELWWCTRADHALACWATCVLDEPYCGKTSSGKNLKPYLLQLVGEQD